MVTVCYDIAVPAVAVQNVIQVFQSEYAVIENCLVNQR